MRNHTNRRLSHRSLAILLAASCVLTIGCDAPRTDSTRAGQVYVRTHGSLRGMFHENQVSSQASLDSMMPNAWLVGVGALSELRGEITILDGEAILSFPLADGTIRTTRSTHSDEGAALLVTSVVSRWSEQVVEKDLAFEEIAAFVSKLASEQGLDIESPFPFQFVGTFPTLKWHVIDGTRLEDGGQSHQDHLKASVQAERTETEATLVGFYSTKHEGVFTHMGSHVHIHAIVPSTGAPDGAVEGSSGHVDHVEIRSGTKIRLPRPLRPVEQPSTSDK